MHVQMFQSDGQCDTKNPLFISEASWTLISNPRRDERLSRLCLTRDLSSGWQSEREDVISNDGCGESNSTVPKNSADEKNCADGAKLCTNETEPSASKVLSLLGCFAGIMNLPRHHKILKVQPTFYCRQQEETCEHSMAEAVREAVDENDGKRDLAVAVDGSWRSVVFLRRMAC
ncbi:hypothetical protein TNCV_787321 [Trichonephila clavipes]|nr:hypothetical protein TNCV_787321 [Trichonephila clavipes]